ncbi:hypothetical protein KFZ70_14305 [Tamlana fucoidanivorans]|uniref:HTH luxR-type domain-containing protein n=1 Tax=Allotamlana fucoidanivorans TaxID=2583814 RepID=A0A5C4SRH6_9FLAO|nr:hypothetical protein [Tamlana fucoidanivorans]TNJ46600.1 hypothetical protein FGF67_02915 [Tamlana fucoidanivorans]
MLGSTQAQNTKDEKELSPQDVYRKATSLQYKYPDSSARLFQYSHDLNLKKGDSGSAAFGLLAKALVFEHQAQYAKSYDELWNALLLIDSSKHKIAELTVYNRLGKIYSYYKREDKALEYLKKSLNIQKQLIKQEMIKPSDLVISYHSITNIYRDLNNPELGEVYLDSAYLYFDRDNTPISKSFLDFEKANILAQKDNNKEALEIMESIAPWFQEKLPSYMVLVYKYWGDIYFNLNNLNKSEELYFKALQTSAEYSSHIDFTPLIYEKLTDLYLKKKDYQKAYTNIKKAKDLDATFFDSRSVSNQPLLEIKDTYRLEKEKQEQKIQAQHLKQLKQEAEIKNLQRIILFVSIIFLIIIGAIYIKNLRARHKSEKLLIQKNKELEIKKASELVELKNKELAASALRLIEKDEFLKNLKTKIREGDSVIKKSDLNKILKTVSINSYNTWDEFRLRFIEVNKEFYDKIFEKFPNLSQGDQKICALIKLNMSSKEMSRLLGISVESVHTSRHRIRKKMKLPRHINLEDYINSL